MQFVGFTCARVGYLDPAHALAPGRHLDHNVFSDRPNNPRHRFRQLGHAPRYERGLRLCKPQHAAKERHRRGNSEQGTRSPAHLPPRMLCALSPSLAPRGPGPITDAQQRVFFHRRSAYWHGLGNLSEARRPDLVANACENGPRIDTVQLAQLGHDPDRFRPSWKRAHAPALERFDNRDRRTERLREIGSRNSQRDAHVAKDGRHPLVDAGRPFGHTRHLQAR